MNSTTHRDTVLYVRDRERVLGAVRVSLWPGIAAEQLAERFGSRADALAWLAEVAEVLDD